MSARVLLVGCALGVIGGCSVFVSTSGLSEESPAAVVTSDAGEDVRVDVEGGSSPPPSDSGNADAFVEADALRPGIEWSENGHRYEVRVYPKPVTWTQARNDAVTAGGHLVTMTSTAEGAFVASIVYARTDAFEGGYGPWIGAHQPDPKANDGGNEPAGGWAWVTGETWSFVDWRAPEPNDHGGDEHVAHYYRASASDRGWNDVDDGSKLVRSSIIEYE